MQVSKKTLQIFTTLSGSLVILSYIYGVSKLADPAQLWGGVPESWQTFIIPFMFIAALGYVIYWWVVLLILEVPIIASLTWPWAESDGKGLNRLFIAYALFLIPSALWLESTSFHMKNDYSWTPVLVIGVLFLVSVGNILLILLAFNAYQNNIKGSKYMLIGSLMISIQCILNDLIIWSYKFPWSA